MRHVDQSKKVIQLINQNIGFNWPIRCCFVIHWNSSEWFQTKDVMYSVIVTDKWYFRKQYKMRFGGGPSNEPMYNEQIQCTIFVKILLSFLDLEYCFYVYWDWHGRYDKSMSSMAMSPMKELPTSPSIMIWNCKVKHFRYSMLTKIFFDKMCGYDRINRYRVSCKSLAPNRCRIGKLLTVNSPLAAPPCVTPVFFTCQGDAVNCMRI